MNSDLKQKAEEANNLKNTILELFKSIENFKMTKKEKELYLEARKVFESGDTEGIKKLMAI